MLTFDTSDMLRVAANLGAAARQTRFVAAFAMNNAMKEAREAEVALMGRVFDRPTRYTLNSLQVVPASKTRLVVELRPKEFGGTPAWRYLGPQIQGGPRKPKGFERALQRAGILRSGEFAMPAPGFPRDGSGNMRRGMVTRMLSALGANPDAMANTTRRPKRGNRRRNLDYFVLRGTKAHNGIYLRVGRKAVPQILFVGQPTYRARFPFYQEARRVFPSAFRRHFHAGWQRFVVNDPGRKRA